MTVRKSSDRAEELMSQVRPYLSSHRRAAHKFSPSRSALLVIDMQRYFLDKSSRAYLPDSSDILDNVASLIKMYRAKSLPIIYTRHAHTKNEMPGAMERWWKELIRDTDEMSKIVPELRPRSTETVLRKNRYSAFVGTDLEERLRAMDVTSVVIAGVMTHLCCESTARDAFMRDLDVFFVIDGTASQSEDLHVSSLKTLTDGFAIPVTTKEVIGWVKNHKS
jgi:bifunctional isochorismate lyase/aryl carrier protein